LVLFEAGVPRILPAAHLEKPQDPKDKAAGDAGGCLVGAGCISPRARFDPFVLTERLLRGQLREAQGALRRLHDGLDHLSYGEASVAHTWQLQASLKEMAAPPVEARGDRAADLFAAVDWDSPAEESKEGFEMKHYDRIRSILTGPKAVRLEMGSAPGVEVARLLAVARGVCCTHSREGVLDEAGKKFYSLAHTANEVTPPGEVMSAIPYHGVAWALHSETQEILLEACIEPYAAEGEKVPWEAIRNAGIPFWLQSRAALMDLSKKAANVKFDIKSAAGDPLDAALFYLAMDKKVLLVALLKKCANTKMANFFAQNFSEDKPAKAAIANAYRLLSLRRFELAAAFFLLAGKVDDAVDICVNSLDDIALGFFIARLVGGDDGTTRVSPMRTLLEKHISSLRSQRLRCDPYLRSVAQWWLKRYPLALDALLGDVDAVDEEEGDKEGTGERNSGETPASLPAEQQPGAHEEPPEGGPSLPIFYRFLSEHPSVQHTVRDQKRLQQTIDRLDWAAAHALHRGGASELGLEASTELAERAAAAAGGSGGSGGGAVRECAGPVDPKALKQIGP